MDKDTLAAVVERLQAIVRAAQAELVEWKREEAELRALALRFETERNHYRSEWVRVGADRDRLSLAVLTLTNERDEARARSAI